MTSQEKLVAWMGDDHALMALAAWAEGYVVTEYPSVAPGSEKFYALVLAKARTTKVVP